MFSCVFLIAVQLTSKMQWNLNGSLIEEINKELPKTSNFYSMLISILAAIVWIVYLTYYNSRVFGLCLTLILNRFIKFGHVQLGKNNEKLVMSLIIS